MLWTSSIFWSGACRARFESRGEKFETTTGFIRVLFIYINKMHGTVTGGERNSYIEMKLWNLLCIVTRPWELFETAVTLYRCFTFTGSNRPGAKHAAVPLHVHWRCTAAYPRMFCTSTVLSLSLSLYLFYAVCMLLATWLSPLRVPLYNIRGV